MAAIRHRGNRSTEGVFAALLRSHRVSGWKLHSLQVTGRPDFYFPARRVTIFVDGCFWHGCPKCFQAPKQNASFWAHKIERNRKRDRKVTISLRAEGFKVIRLWEHDLESRTLKLRRVLELLAHPKNSPAPTVPK